MHMLCTAYISVIYLHKYMAHEKYTPALDNRRSDNRSSCFAKLHIMASALMNKRMYKKTKKRSVTLTYINVFLICTRYLRNCTCGDIYIYIQIHCTGECVNDAVAFSIPEHHTWHGGVCAIAGNSSQRTIHTAKCHIRKKNFYRWRDTSWEHKNMRTCQKTTFSNGCYCYCYAS